MPFKWWIRSKLKRAARLHRKGVLNEHQYSYLAIKFGQQLLGQPLALGTRIELQRFDEDLLEQLKVKRDENLSKTLAIYGPWHAATVKVKSDGERHLEALKVRNLQESHPVLTWTGDFENAAKSAELLLSPFNRWGFAFQSWWQEQERILPVVSKAVVFILGLVIGGVIGALLERMTHKP